MMSEFNKLVMEGGVSRFAIKMGDRGVSVVVGALIVISISIAAFINFYLHYSLTESSKAEAEHMQLVRGSFLDIKSAVEAVLKGESRSVSIQMAAKPSFLVKGLGTVGVLLVENIKDMFNTIRFSIANVYHPNQEWAYECGAVILSQEGKDLMASKPALITAWGATGENIELHVWYIWLKNSKSSIASKADRTVTITCVESYHAVENEHVENVVVDLTGDVRYRDAWRDYLEYENKELNEKGYNASLENLKLTILGKVITQGVPDIFYYEKVTKILVRFS